jgi:hypothetical protein
MYTVDTIFFFLLLKEYLQSKSICTLNHFYNTFFIITGINRLGGHSVVSPDRLF